MEITIKENYKSYLIEHGYKQYTDNGVPSTVFDYIKRIEKVLEWERLTWDELFNDIKLIRLQYEPDGKKASYGKTSHNAVINALRRFEEFKESKEYIK